jgi:two-component system response regulator
MTSKGTLLLVEDNADDIELTLLAFEQTSVSINIVTAQDGVEALQYLFPAVDATAKPLPDLILLDLQLPRVSGLEVLQQIKTRDRTRLIPVVILTTSNEERDRLQGYELGCNSYICKPVDYRQSIQVLQQLGLYWFDLNSSPPLLAL